MKEVRKRYEEVGLPRHEGKAVFGGEKACFWGLQADGKAGTFRPNLKRCIPLCFIAAEVIRIGRATVGLLEALTGAFVSVFSEQKEIHEHFGGTLFCPEGAGEKRYNRLQWTSNR